MEDWAWGVKNVNMHDRTSMVIIEPLRSRMLGLLDGCDGFGNLRPR